MLIRCFSNMCARRPTSGYGSIRVAAPALSPKPSARISTQPAAEHVSSGRRSAIAAARVQALVPMVSRAFDMPPGKKVAVVLSVLVLHYVVAAGSRSVVAVFVLRRIVWLQAREATVQKSLVDGTDCGAVK